MVLPHSDAGDFSLYSASINSSLFWLLSAVADFSPREDDTGIPKFGNGMPDLLDEARWGLEWLLSVQESGGGFQNTTCQELYGRKAPTAPTHVALPRGRGGHHSHRPRRRDARIRLGAVPS